MLYDFNDFVKNIFNIYIIIDTNKIQVVFFLDSFHEELKYFLSFTYIFK